MVVPIATEYSVSPGGSGKRSLPMVCPSAISKAFGAFDFGQAKLLPIPARRLPDAPKNSDAIGIVPVSLLCVHSFDRAIGKLRLPLPPGMGAGIAGIHKTLVL